MPAFFASVGGFFADLIARWRRPRPWPKPDPVPPPPPPPVLIPAKVIKGVPYGPDPLQFIDLYIPEHYDNERLVVEAFDHGGGWRRGDADSSVYAKADHANAKKRIFASISYRLGVDSTPVVPVWTQAQDLAAAYGWLVANIAQYHGNPAKLIRVGHSAGAHLMELVCSNVDLAVIAGPYLGSVCLDTAASDVPATMRSVPYLSPDLQKLYVDAFGIAPYAGPDYEHQCDPMGQMDRKQPPKLLVFSNKRGPANESTCRAYGTKAHGFGTQVTIYASTLKHGEINSLLGTPCELTDVYDAFVDGLLAA